jgi:hypothetical protein
MRALPSVEWRRVGAASVAQAGRGARQVRELPEISVKPVAGRASDALPMPS